MPDVIRKDSNTKALALLFFLALALRLVYMFFFFGIEYAPDTDTPQYSSYAENLAKGNGYTDGKLRAFRPPGYPFFLGGVYYVFGQSFKAAKIVQAIVSSLIPLIIFYIGLRLFNRKYAFYAALYSCLYLGLIYEPARIISESVFTFLFAATILLFMYADKGRKFAVTGGIFLGLTSLTRPVGMILFPLVLLWIFFKQPAARGIKTCVLITLAYVITMLPWTVRNYRMFGEFIPVALETGCVVKQIHVPTEVSDINKNNHLPELEMDRQNLKEGLEYLKAQNPLRLLKGGFLRLLQISYPFLPSYDLTFVLMYPFFIYGVYLVVKTGNINAYALFSIFLYIPVVFAFQACPRYRHSMAPGMILLAAMGIEQLINRVIDKKKMYAALFMWLMINVLIWNYSEPIRLVARRINRI